jgi:hypothetical protein
MALIGVLLGCGGPTVSGPGAADPRLARTGDGDDDDDDDTAGRDPEQRLRGLVEEVVGLAEDAACSDFGAALTGWTDTHAGDIESLIAALGKSESDDVLAELDAYVETRRLVVLEAAANCGDFDDAWPAWQHFEEMVDEARE